jgi:hypothetical protein
VWSIPEDSVGKGTITDNKTLTPTAKGTLKLTAAIANGGVDGATYTKTFEIPISITPVTDITGVPETGMVQSSINLSGVIVEPADASYKTIVWSVAAGSPASGTITGSVLTPTSKGVLKLTATIANGGVNGATYTKTFDINAASNITADVSFQTTETDTSATVFSSWTGAGTAAQSVNISAVEQPAVYFAVGKTAAQTITVGGAAAGLVTQTANGRTLDGSLASADLNVFAVDTSAFDLMFEGGNRTFTLTVSEPGMEPAAVTVNLNIATNKTVGGVSVFRVTRSAGNPWLPPLWGTTLTDHPVTPAAAEAWAKQGSLERILDIKEWVPGDQFNAPGSEGTAAGTKLIDALHWVNKNAQDSEEYLIRVEKNEELPITQISFPDKRGVTLRLRGDGTERMIKHNKLTERYSLSSTWSSLGANGFIIFQGTIVSPATYHSLHLESGITLDGLGAERTNSYFYNGFLTIGQNCRLVMLEGSKITNFDTKSYEGAEPVITFNGGTGSNATLINQNSNGSFYMYGGAITGHYLGEYYLDYVYQGVGNSLFKFSPVNVDGATRGDRLSQSVFFKYGGSISGNFIHLQNGSTLASNRLYFGGGSPAASTTLIVGGLVDSQTYVLPQFDADGVWVP